MEIYMKKKNASVTQTEKVSVPISDIYEHDIVTVNKGSKPIEGTVVHLFSNTDKEILVEFEDRVVHVRVEDVIKVKHPKK